MTRTVLVVEDNEDNRALVVKVLSRHGYRFMFLEPQEKGEPQWRVLTRDHVLRPRELPPDIELQLLLNDLPQSLPQQLSDKEKPQVFMFASGERTPFTLRFMLTDTSGYQVAAAQLGQMQTTQVTP